MTEIDKIQAQIESLLRAHKYLTNLTSPDKNTMEIIQTIADDVSSLTAKQSALRKKTTTIPDLTAAQVTKLQTAIHDLDKQIKASAIANDILVAVTAMLK